MSDYNSYVVQLTEFHFLLENVSKHSRQQEKKEHQKRKKIFNSKTVTEEIF